MAVTIDGTGTVTGLSTGGLPDGSIAAADLATDAVTGAKIVDNAINSEHYTDGSIDTAHIADDQITLAKMASGTDGNIISYDASGNPVAIATGSDGQVLTSTGAGSPPAFETIAAGLTSFAGYFSKNLNDATGTTAYTGVGFKPTCILFFAGGSNPGAGYGSWGFVDSALTDRCLMDYNNVSSDSYDVHTYVIWQSSSHPNRYKGNVTVFGDDGFSIAWTKDNTMSGTITVNYLALK